MRVGLTMRVVGESAYHEVRDALSHDWIDWIQAREHQPVLIPNGIADADAYLKSTGIDALILTGGNDVVPKACGSDETSALRNETEKALLIAALQRDLPVLGTCRGMHVINLFFGGAVVSDLRAIAGEVKHVGSLHAVELSTPFSTVAGTDAIATNSYHNQGVTADGIGTDLKPFAVSPGDGLIEGVFHPRRAVLGMQWHPERPGPSTAFDDAVIFRLFREGVFW